MSKLPPDPDELNDIRAEWASSALRRFQIDSGSDYEDALTDLLCDFMHLCDRDDDVGGFDKSLERARMHYEAETAKQ